MKKEKGILFFQLLEKYKDYQGLNKLRWNIGGHGLFCDIIVSKQIKICGSLNELNLLHEDVLKQSENEGCIGYPNFQILHAQAKACNSLEEINSLMEWVKGLSPSYKLEIKSIKLEIMFWYLDRNIDVPDEYKVLGDNENIIKFRKNLTKSIYDCNRNITNLIQLERNTPVFLVWMLSEEIIKSINNEIINGRVMDLFDINNENVARLGNDYLMFCV